MEGSSSLSPAPSTISVSQWLAGGSQASPRVTVFSVPLLFVSRGLLAELSDRACYLVLAGQRAWPHRWSMTTVASGDLAANALGPGSCCWSRAGASRSPLPDARRGSGPGAGQGQLDEEEAREEARVDRLTGIEQPAGLRGGAAGRDLARQPDGDAAEHGDGRHRALQGDQRSLRSPRRRQRRCDGVTLSLGGNELRLPDRAFRWGGDEFVLLLPGRRPRRRQGGDRAGKGERSPRRATDPTTSRSGSTFTDAQLEPGGVSADEA